MQDFELIPLLPNFSIEEVEGQMADPSLEVLELIEKSWSEAQSLQGGQLFNGNLLTLVGLEARKQLEQRGVLTGKFTEYRHFHAQYKERSLFESLRVRPLAITGLVRTEGKLMAALRGPNVMQDRSVWELAPAGGLTMEARAANTIDPIIQALQELEEETDIPRSAVRTAEAKALLVDNVTHVHDVVVEITLSIKAYDALKCFRSRKKREYIDCQFVAENDLAEFVRALPVSKSTAILAEHWIKGVRR